MAEISQSFSKKLIFKRFKLEKLLATSKFSWVYEGKNIIKNTPVAMKIEKEGEYDLLESEAYILTITKGLGIPKVITFGRHSQYKILVEECLGNNLQELWESGPFKNVPSGQKNTYIKDICLLAMQGLERLKHIHDKNIIHRDIKPENFIIGQNDPDVIYLIDFGFAKKYRSSRTGKHINFSYLNHVIGSWNFSSHNAIRGYEGSRRDDLESFGYMLIYFAKGGWTPWVKYLKMNNLSKNDKAKIITDIKLEISEENLCKGLPNEFVNYMKYVKNLEFEEEPNYEYLTDLFISILSKNEFKRNIKFFWMEEKSKKYMKKINESLENRNKVVKKSSAKSVKSFSINRLYNKIKDSLDKNLINETNQKGCNKSEKKINLHFKKIKTNAKDKINNSYEKINSIINTKKCLIAPPTNNIICHNTLSKFNKSKAMNKTLNANTINNNSSMYYKIQKKIKRSCHPIKLTYKYNNYNTNISSFNNINDKKIFLNNNNQTFIKINIHKYFGFNKNKTPDIRMNDLNLKKDIIYKPIFQKNI